MKGLVCDVNLSTANELTLSNVRFQVFETSTSTNFRSLPPAEDALYQQVLRSCFQAGWVWGYAVHQNNIPSKSEWGWFIDEARQLYMTWTTSSSTGLIAKLFILVNTGPKC